MGELLQTVETDVLVIGGGAAAAMSALEAAKSGVAVAVLDKGRLGQSGATPLAGGGVAGYLGPTATPDDAPGNDADSAEQFAADILNNGCGICDERVVEVLARQSGEALLEAQRLGVPFALKPDGSLAARSSQGQQAARAYPVLGGGPALATALARQVREKGITILERTAAIKLLVVDGQVVGGVALNVVSGEWLSLRCKAVVLAAGGAPALYSFTSSSQSLTGDAFALAVDAGCRLANMEFVEFTLIPVVRGRPILMGGLGQFLVRGARLRNSQDELFMARYDPERADLANKASMTRAVYEEMAAGRGPVRMDVSQIDPELWEDLHRKAPHMLARLERAGWSPPSGDLHWTPAAHFNLGGVEIDSRARTNVDGLFVVGECANGVHGAERMGGNALLECLVFGRVAGRSASTHATARRSVPWDSRMASETIALQRSRLSSDSAREELAELRKGLQRTAWEGLGVSRDEMGLRRCADRLEGILVQLQGIRAGSHQELLRQLELESLVLTGKMVAEAARLRLESRGAHQRWDYPHRDDARWRRWIAFRKRGGGLEPMIEPVPGG